MLGCGKNWIGGVNICAVPVGVRKREKLMDCAEVLENGNTESRVYTIRPRSRFAERASIDVQCDLVTEGGGWTVKRHTTRCGVENHDFRLYDESWMNWISFDSAEVIDIFSFNCLANDLATTKV
ncbi:hypothetical protein AVEN_69506-1 [Araneus ventricosus]|uniref:Fibrinogen C-terminal domain-containing protein n=1 Tax=Araneus ventricosus TaxID=182803 RepID=A0A4Y2QY85_ARAVE|nr:hypothetical protein AVEN_69506-1 [Araneus ventricosus]